MRRPNSLQKHLRKSAIHDSDELTSDLHPSQLGHGGGIERAIITAGACKAAPHQSTVQTTPLKLSSDASHPIEALKIEALEHIEKRVLQYKHRAARPVAYTTDGANFSTNPSNRSNQPKVDC
jgi:hypothetical protein